MNKTNEAPYKAIGNIIVHVENGQKQGTGFLIGDNLVLTAAHNLMYNGKRVDVDLINFCIGHTKLDDRKKYESESTVEEIFIASAYEKECLRGCDFGLLKLSDNLGKFYGTIELKTFAYKENSNIPAEIYGYPFHKKDINNYIGLYGMNENVFKDKHF